jgi:hypothetical protein
MASQVRMTCTGCGGFAGYGYTQYSVCHNCNVKSDRQHKEIMDSMSDPVTYNELSDDDYENIFRVLVSMGLGGVVAYYCYKHGWLNDSTGRAWTLVWTIAALVLGYTKLMLYSVATVVGVSFVGGVLWGIYYWITHP